MAVVKRVGVVSVGKVMGGIYALIGLIGGAIFSLVSLLGIATSGAQESLMAGLFGIGAIVVLPILYGIVGFIGGILFGAAYNLIGSTIGGIEVDIESD